MDERDRLQRLAAAKAVSRFRNGGVSRRKFLRLCAEAGFGFGSLAFLSACQDDSSQNAPPEPTNIQVRSALTPSCDEFKFLRDVGRAFAGTTLRVVSENTAPSKVIREIARREFTPLTGIKVIWETMPLDRVLAEVASDTARGAGAHDIFYLDQAWTGRFHQDAADPRELMANSDLAYPHYNFDDFIPSLVKYTASYKDRLFGVPYDIPIFIMMYRRDVFDELGLTPPVDMAGYARTVKAVHQALAPKVYGTTGEWKAGHSSLECDMTAWLWGKGGSIYGPDRRPTINDERAEAAMEYMLNLGKYMPPGVTTWDWFGQRDNFAQGRAGIYIGYGALFPSYDDPSQSKIVGLAAPAPCPREDSLRGPAECSFDEKPGICHQGGSSLAISRYSKQIEAAWILLQWATSADVAVRACLLGGGSSMVRRSTYDDPRVKERSKVAVGTTRHFKVVKDAILNRMGSEPHLPAWPSLSEVAFPAELGKMTTGQQGVKTTLANMAKAAEKAAAR